MFAVFRYSTKTILSYFTEESSAILYCEDQNKQDYDLWLTLDAASSRAYVPDWGYKAMSIADSVDELIENYGEDSITTISDWYGDDA